MKIMSPDEVLRATLAALEAEHRLLDAQVAELSSSPGAAAPSTSLELQRLKKRKLALKDRISSIKDRLNPDIIA